MKRPREYQEEEEEEDLQNAILLSLGQVVPSRGRREDERVEKELAVRQQALDTLYAEMCQSAQTMHQRKVALENMTYNKKTTTLLSIELVLVRIMAHATMSTLGALYRTSKNVASIMDKVIERFPITSVRVESTKAFMCANMPDFYGGPFFEKVTETVNTIRFKIRCPSYALTSRVLIHPSIKHIIVSVSSQEEINWFRRSFVTESIHVIIYYEKNAFSDKRARLTYRPWKGCEEIIRSIDDPFSCLFDSLKNIENTVEQ